ncbi:MAG: endonuclease [Alloprevotella sp.]|nr:endonuclease [Bacteroidales bacterium]MDY3943511.1 endonuclease [Alloprevotella sp.]
MKRPLLTLLCLLLSTVGFAQTAEVKLYYSAANQEKAAQLKTALYKIITEHKERTYNDLWSDFSKTDKRTDGTVWDMYSKVTTYTMQGAEQGKTARKEGDAYNREHSFPKSWFNNGYPMYTDLFHLYPVDAYINTRRSNYPYGETDGDRYTTTSGFSKLGQCTTPGYSGTVFEPNDEYKGDLARTYFYMVTAYESQIPNWRTAEGARATLDGKTYPGLSEWQLKMLMRWAKQDTVSTKERDRNNAVYGIQGNRNPFIDYPGLEVYVWGDSVNVPVNLLAYTNPYTGRIDTTAIDSTLINPKDTTIVVPQPTDSTAGSTIGLSDSYVLVTSVDDLVEGKHYIIANDEYDAVMGPDQGKYFERIESPVDANGVNFENDPDGVTILTLRKYLGNYAFELATGGYLSYTSGNTLNTATELDATKTQWAITITADGKHNITHVATGRNINYNSTYPRFAAYSTPQKPVMLYVENPTATGLHTVLRPEAQTVVKTTGVYDLSGRSTNATKGIVILNGKKVILK